MGFRFGLEPPGGGGEKFNNVVEHVENIVVWED